MHGDTVISVALSDKCTMFAAGGTNKARGRRPAASRAPVVRSGARHAQLATVRSTDNGDEIAAFDAKAGTWHPR